MNRRTCPEENATLHAARSGRFDDRVQAHLAECDLCRGILQTSRWMQSLAEASPADRSLPEPGLLWWRVELAQRQAQAERAHRPLDWIEGMAAVSAVAALAGGFAWFWMAFGAQAADFSSSWMSLWDFAAQQSASTYGLLVIASALAALAYPLLFQE